MTISRRQNVKKKKKKKKKLCEMDGLWLLKKQTSLNVPEDTFFSVPVIVIYFLWTPADLVWLVLLSSPQPRPSLTVWVLDLWWMNQILCIGSCIIGRFRYTSSTTYMDRSCADVISCCVVLFPASFCPSFPNVWYVWKPLYTYGDNV